MKTQISATLEEILVGMETDHGLEFTTGEMARFGPHSKTDNEIGSVCAMGNAAVDILKREGKHLSVYDVREVGNSIYSAWNKAVQEILNINEEKIYSDEWKRKIKVLSDVTADRIFGNNDSVNLSFDQNAAKMREMLTKHGISLETPIIFYG